MNKRIVSIIALAAALTPFVLLISTTNAVKGLAAAPALYMDMKDKSALWQQYAEDSLMGAASAQSVKDTIEPLRVSLCTMAGSEHRDGTLTGSGGDGAVSAGYISACSSVGAISDSLIESGLRGDIRRGIIREAIGRLLEIPEQDNKSIFDRQDQFTDEVAILKEALASVRSDGLRKTVNAQIAVARSSVPKLDTADNAFGRKQDAAIANLERQLSQVERIVHGYLETEDSALLTKPYRLLSSGEAILHYWRRLTPQILTAVGVDLAILWLAAFLAVSRSNLLRMETSTPAQDHSQTGDQSAASSTI